MIGAVMAVSALAAGAYTAYEQREAGKAQQQMYNLQAEQNNKQAERETIQAGLAQIEADKEAQRRTAQLGQDIGATYAGAAGNGVLLNSGSVTSVAKNNITEGYADVGAILNQANLTIWGHNQNAQALKDQAGLNMFAGRQAKAAGNRQAIGTGIKSIGSAASAGVGGMNLGSALHTRYNTDFTSIL
jgi:hypothetical protein